jgi:pyruvate/2-oxoglutarate dehydrogenase complex dihydrolipoamide dehydrogenase (E3) component
MANDKLRLFRKFIVVLVKYGITLLYQRVQAIAHRWTYRDVPSPKNVVVLGGSFAGVSLAKRLTETLPTGYRVVLVEKNSHFNYLFNFPRYSVLQGHEQKAFVPYAGLAKDAPKGIFELVQDLATNIGDGEVELKSGDRITFEYLAIATGTTQNPPAQVRSTEKEDGCRELEEIQAKIKAAKNIAIVGGGPVGVQLAADIQTFYEDKRVVLLHSRSQLLPSFGKRLHEYVVGKLTELGVKVILEERPQLPSAPEAMSLQFKDSKSENFDLVVSHFKNQPQPKRANCNHFLCIDPLYGTKSQLVCHR